MISFITNFNPEANSNQVSFDNPSDPCQYDFELRSSVGVCIDSLASNYFPVADINSIMFNPFVAQNVIIDNASCEFIYGCTDPFAYNFNSEAGVDDGTCIAYSDLIIGCTNQDYLEYDSLASINNDALCISLLVEGCTDLNAINFDSQANIDDESCYYNLEYGCTYENSPNYNPSATIDDGSCLLLVLGCTDVNSLNYDVSASQDDGSCVGYIYGCTNSLAYNYDSLANTDDYSCENVLYGCTDNSSLNYNTLANTDDGHIAILEMS